LPRRPRNNNNISGSANSAHQSNNNNNSAPTNLPASLPNNNTQRTVHTACTAAVHSTYEQRPSGDRKNIPTNIDCMRNTVHQSQVITEDNNILHSPVKAPSQVTGQKANCTHSTCSSSTTGTYYDSYESAFAATVIQYTDDSDTEETSCSIREIIIDRLSRSHIRDILNNNMAGTDPTYSTYNNTLARTYQLHESVYAATVEDFNIDNYLDQDSDFDSDPISNPPVFDNDSEEPGLSTTLRDRILASKFNCYHMDLSES